MKKTLLGLGSVSAIGSTVIGVVSCANGSYKDLSKDTLNIMFIPSRGSNKIQAATVPLQQLIKKELNWKAEVTVASSYQAAASALKSGSIDIAFLPYSVVKDQGGLKYIVTAVRNTIKWDGPKNAGGPSNDGFDDSSIDARAIYDLSQNRDEDNFTYNNDNKATWYRSQVMTKNSDKITKVFSKLWAADSDKSGDLSSSEIAEFNKINSTNYQSEKAITQYVEQNIRLIYTSLNSGAGYLQAVKAIKRVPGLATFNISNAPDSNKIQSSGYEDSFSKLKANNTGWASMGVFSGVEAQSTWKAGFPNTTKSQFLSQTAIIAISRPIINDGIQIAKDSTISPGDVAKISDFFIKTVKVKKNVEDIYGIYSHKGYTKNVRSVNDTL